VIIDAECNGGGCDDVRRRIARQKMHRRQRFEAVAVQAVAYWCEYEEPIHLDGCRSFAQSEQWVHRPHSVRVWLL
jgi:hypothetical protein